MIGKVQSPQPKFHATLEPKSTPQPEGASKQAQLGTKFVTIPNFRVPAKALHEGLAKPAKAIAPGFHPLAPTVCLAWNSK